MGVEWLFGVLRLASGQAEAEPEQSEPRACSLSHDPVLPLEVLIIHSDTEVLQEEPWSPCTEQDLRVWKPGNVLWSTCPPESLSFLF